MPARRILGLAFALLIAPSARAGEPPDPTAAPPADAQPAAEPSGEPRTSQPKAGESALDKVPPSLRLGLRAAFVQSRMPTSPVVVIVPDERSFVAAMGAWNLDAGTRFPVLIDDGSWPARQAIARFVRAFSPRKVVRWSATEGNWPEDAAARRTLIERTAARPWLADLNGEKSVAESLNDQWAALKFRPPGVVVASATDPAWPAALTLAAARGQPILWLDAPGTPERYMMAADADALERRIEALLDPLPWKWNQLGDDLDAVTLCLNCATKVFVGEAGKGDQRGMLALTDLIGRRVGPESDTARKDRWAWAGQIIGSAWQSAYAAQCAVFLRPESAWCFDGYDDTPPWNNWDATAAGAAFEAAGLKVIVDDGNSRRLIDWRDRTATGIDAQIITINSSGNADFFELKPGLARPADVPILARPALVHFVHSWSAAAPSDVRTVAGRWLERGAYAYVGSVHEPYLHAFCPTPKFAQRLIVGLPLGAAARIDDGEVWKINILGDPLITIGRASGIRPGPMVDRPINLPGAVDVQEDLPEALGARDFARALTDLTLLGRDRDAARLLEAALREQRDAVTPEAALAGLTPALLSKDLPTLTSAAAIALPLMTTEGTVEARGLWDARDMVWHALYPGLFTLPRDRAELLGLLLRKETLARDAQEAFSAVRSAVTPEAAQGVVQRALGIATTGDERREIERIGK